MKKTLLIISAILFLPAIAFAAPASITAMVANVAKVIVLIATILVVIFWIITGLLFLSAQGAPEKINLARKALFSSIAGTALVILAQVAITIIDNALSFGF